MSKPVLTSVFTQHVNHGASPSATTAAAQAFLANKASNASLSAAAAAAALRSHTTSPVPVGDVQTKRAVRRSGSIASIGSAAGSVPAHNAGTLRRRGSSGSMTERTFRTPSPVAAGPRLRTESLPPVPALPKNIPPIPQRSHPVFAQRPATASQSNPPPVPQKSHRRSSSVEAAIPGIASPPPTAYSGRGMSVDGGAGVSPVVLAAQRATGVDGPPRSDSRASMNFSRPMPRSPTLPIIDDGRDASESRLTQSSPSPFRVGGPGLEAARPQGTGRPATQDGSEQTWPAPKKKKKQSAGVGAGNGNRANGSGISTSPAASNVDSIAGADPTAGSSPARREKKAAASPINVPSERPASAASYHSDLEPISEDANGVSGKPKRFKTRAAGLLAKQPSVVRENRELEDEAEGFETPATSGYQRPEPVTPQESKIVKPATTTKRAGARQHTRSASQPAGASTGSAPAVKATQDDKLNSRLVPGSGGRGGRPQSVSPTRYAHFATTPPALSLLPVRHEPPPRSLSPVKSAMKHSPSPRSGSAASQASNVAFTYQGGSDVSVVSDDGTPSSDPTKKRRNRRVSFDDLSGSVSGDTRPRRQSPHGGNSLQSPRDGDSLTVTPTPALLSIGSARGPPEPEHSLQSESDSLTASPLGASSDHALGEIISRDFAIKRAGAGEITGGQEGQEDNVDLEHGVVPSIELIQPTPSLEQAETQPSWNSTPGLHEEGESDESGDNIYSDAEEDLSGLDGHSFGSIDAVIDSPSVDSTPGVAVSTPPESPTKLLPNKSKLRAAQRSDTGGVNGSKTENGIVDRGPGPSASDAPEAPKTKRKKRKTVVPVSSTEPVLPPARLRPESMGRPMDRVAHPNEDKPMTALKKNRLASAPNGPSTTISPAVRDEVRKINSPPLQISKASAPQRKTRPAKLVKRTVSAGSDSSASTSSFKKSRPSLTSERVIMRRSMRAGSQPAEPSSARPRDIDDSPAQPKSSRFSIRSLSPTGITPRKPFSPPPSARNPGKGIMKGSLRGPQAAATPTLRSGSLDGAKPRSGFGGFNKQSKAKTPSRKPRLSRRFSGSSDDGNGLPNFRSRFDDSSDDDQPERAPFTPVRGIPRRIGEAENESTDLPNSSEDEATRSKAKTQKPKGQETSALAIGSLRQGGQSLDSSSAAQGTQGQLGSTGKHKKKRSLFAALSRRKDHQKGDISATVATLGSPSETNQPDSQPSQLNGSTSLPATPFSHPKTKRRWTSRIGSLPGPPPIPASPPHGNDSERPTTSDGVPTASQQHQHFWERHGRPGLASRRISSMTAPEPGRETVGTAGKGRDMGVRFEDDQTPTRMQQGYEMPGGGSGKKKKFGALRRAFGLHD